MQKKTTLLNAAMIALGVGFAGVAGATGQPADERAPVAEEGAAKDFGCGAKGQKACPMQGWMKTVMQTASSSGDGAKLAEALEHVAGKVPPGMAKWSTIAKDGAAKAKKGDIDGAKESCKACHDAYKAEYKAKLRDLAF